MVYTFVTCVFCEDLVKEKRKRKKEIKMADRFAPQIYKAAVSRGVRWAEVIGALALLRIVLYEELCNTSVQLPDGSFDIRQSTRRQSTEATSLFMNSPYRVGLQQSHY